MQLAKKKTWIEKKEEIPDHGIPAILCPKTHADTVQQLFQKRNHEVIIFTPEELLPIETSPYRKLFSKLYTCDDEAAFKTREQRKKKLYALPLRIGEFILRRLVDWNIPEGRYLGTNPTEIS